MSKYDNITTAADLIAEVRANGLSTSQEDINRAADIFGNTAVGVLARLANDVGRNNSDGLPDPQGTWTSTRQPTQSTFYQIAFTIWHWEQATAFYNEHTNPAAQERRDLKAEIKALKAERVQLIEELNKQATKSADLAHNVEVLQPLLGESNNRADAAEAQVLQLKAKLYDYMTEGK